MCTPPQPQGDKPEDEKSRNAIEALKEVSEEIQKLRRPTGEQKAPGRTCREIAAGAKEPIRNGRCWPVLGVE